MNNKIIAAKEIPQEELIGISFDGTFQERSELAQEIITREPDFYEKWALLVFLIILLIITACSWFIKYPDIIKAPAVLIGQNAPKEIVPKQSGKITALFVKNNQQVKQGEILGWIESSADTREVIDLNTRLDSCIEILNKKRPDIIPHLFLKRFTSLGELQSKFQVFNVSLLQYSDYIINGFYSKRKTMLQRDILSLQNMENKVAQQKDFILKDNELAKKTFEMNEQLYKDKVISAEEYRQAQSVLLNKQKVDPQIDVSMLTQQNLIRDKQKEIDQLSHDIMLQQQIFEQALQTLKSNVEEWLRQYTIQAPTDGNIVLAIPLQQNQYIEQGKLIGFVNPVDSKYYVELHLAQHNFGKVDTGMQVQLRFDAYPYQEVGFVPGTLQYVSSISVDSAFLGTVRVEKGLLTNQHKSIQYRNGLKATAFIITKEMRLLERLYYSLAGVTSLNK